MARLNIEDDFWLDPRRSDLAEKLGEDASVGHLLRFWRVAQYHWKRGELIPEDRFKWNRFSDALFECNLAERRETGIYCKGSEEQFGWIKKKAENGAAGGRKSGASRRMKSLNKCEANASKLKPLPLPLPLPLLKDKKEEEKEAPEKLILDECFQEFDKSYQFFKIHREARQDGMAFARLIQGRGPDSVKRALRGARMQKAFPGFNPADHFSMAKLMDPSTFNKWETLGSRTDATDPIVAVEQKTKAQADNDRLDEIIAADARRRNS